MGTIVTRKGAYTNESLQLCDILSKVKSQKRTPI